MPHHKSAWKRLRTNKKRNLRNRQDRTRLRGLTRDLRDAGEKENAGPALQQLVSRLDKAAKTGLLHKNQVARRKSRAQKLYNRISAE